MQLVIACLLISSIDSDWEQRMGFSSNLGILGIYIAMVFSDTRTEKAQNGRDVDL